MDETDVTPAGAAMGVTMAVDESEVVAMEAAVMEPVVTAVDVMALAVTSPDVKVAGAFRYVHWDVMANLVKVEKAVSVLRLTVRRGKASHAFRARTSATHRDVP
jgi:hypothetical protein